MTNYKSNIDLVHVHTMDVAILLNWLTNILGYQFTQEHLKLLPKSLYKHFVQLQQQVETVNENTQSEEQGETSTKQT